MIMEEKEKISFSEKLRSLKFLWIFLGAAAVISVIAAVILFKFLGQYDSYTTVSKTDISGRDGSFMEFSGALLSYSRDGATLSDYRGELLWTVTYDMQTPTVVTCQGELLIYDKSGSVLVIMNREGEQGELKTNLPVVRADISADGVVAVLMQDRETGYINVYKADGGLVAGGQVHLENTGYPISLAISPDGQRLLVSMICVAEGTSSAQLSFYDFDEAGASKKDNIIASFNYAGEVYPEVDFFDDGSAVAFGTDQIVIYTAGDKPETKLRLTPDSEIGSVFCSGSGFGILTKTSQEKKSLKIYDTKGKLRFEKTIRLDYSRAEFLTNGDVLIANGQQLILYNPSGIRRFHYTFSDGFLLFVPNGGLRDYVLVERGKCSCIRLK